MKAYSSDSVMVKFLKRISKLAISKALEKLRKTPIVYSPSSIALEILSVSSRMACSVELLLQNPY
jgi:hypothetical protein